MGLFRASHSSSRLDTGTWEMKHVFDEWCELTIEADVIAIDEKGLTWIEETKKDVRKRKKMKNGSPELIKKILRIYLYLFLILRNKILKSNWKRDYKNTKEKKMQNPFLFSLLALVPNKSYICACFLLFTLFYWKHFDMCSLQQDLVYCKSSEQCLLGNKNFSSHGNIKSG